MIIRKATENDMPSILGLIQELATFENEPDAVKIDKDTLVKYGTGSNPLFTCFLAEKNQSIVGMALVYFRFSTWAGKALHLEDLIVSKAHRGKGYGKALYNAVMKYADNQEVNRVEWEVLNWNKNAINFYKKNGAQLFEDWYLVQMDKEQLTSYLKNENKLSRKHN